MASRRWRYASADARRVGDGLIQCTGTCVGPGDGPGVGDGVGPGVGERVGDVVGSGVGSEEVGEIVRHRQSQIPSVNFDIFNAPPFHDLSKATSYGFDFGQFGHRGKVAGTVHRRYPQTYGI